MTRPSHRRPPLLAALSAALALLPLGAPAHAQAAAPTKVSQQRCGGYTLNLRSNGFEDPLDSVSITRGAATYATVKDTMVSVNWCRDVTGDGVPEVLIAGFSGGAHCCFTQHLYTLSTPPRELLSVFTADSGSMEPRQLDGKGAYELVGDDWRFAYGYGMSFAESLPLPVVYSYLTLPDGKGRYVENTRAFPGYLETAGLLKPGDDRFSGSLLVEYGTRVVTRGAADADAWARTQKAPFAAWLANYGPDIRQDLSDVGLRDWPARAGADPNADVTGIGGAFTSPGTRAYLAQVIGTNSAALHLYQPLGTGVTAGPVLMTVPVTRDEYGSPTLTVWPALTVRRATGRDDALIRDERSGSVRYAAYRVGSAALTELKDDPLALTTRLLSDLSAVAGHVASQYSSAPRTAAQKAEVQRRIDAAVTRAQPWLDVMTGPTAVPLRRLGNFTFGSVTLTRDGATQAQAEVTTTVGLTDEKTDSDYVEGRRSTMTVNLTRGESGWQITDWTVVPRTGEVYPQ